MLTVCYKIGKNIPLFHIEVNVSSLWLLQVIFLSLCLWILFFRRSFHDITDVQFDRIVFMFM